MEREKISNYFKLWEGESHMRSEMDPVVKPALEVLFHDGELIEEPTMFDNDAKLTLVRWKKIKAQHEGNI